MSENATCILVVDAIRSEGLDDITTNVTQDYKLVVPLFKLRDGIATDQPAGLKVDVNQFWQEEMTQRQLFVKSAFTLVYGLLFILGLVGNGGVVFAMANNRRLRSARNIFLLNLILTDLLLVLTAVPVTPCWSLTAISIDKYLHIIDPTKAPVTKRQALAITLLIWLLSTLINVPYLLSYELVDGSYYVPKDR
ncbi:hypothetical protein TELCIR_06841 [Teladorsagia circumcincta]|uniref:G-protein coupled receptors family 1 profile domain-containing protein n=1 Tax=Teladorsagia circumcincta TaxID=45464 RepID=A0A2G9ULZ6_TELCI|nr:hypothetical protein TELCIR_06841 [Teladorsagia circumcincta]